VGHDRQDQPGHSSGQRASIREAAELLSTTVDAIRKRVQRGTIPYEKASDGRVWILLDAVQDSTGHRQDTDQPQSATDALISQMQERITSLERQLDQEREANSEHRRLLLRALERIPPQLEVPSQARESPQTDREEPERAEPRPATGGAQEGARRPWWQRWFGG
jgi:hypothetical protein